MRITPSSSTTNSGVVTGKVPAVAGAIFKRFGSVKDLWRLREQGLGAADRLATFLEGVVSQLYESQLK